MSKNSCSTSGECCELEAVVSFDERGQLVIPKDVRKKFNVQPGEKLALISCFSEGELCCFTLVRTKSMQGVVQRMLEPVFRGMATT